MAESKVIIKGENATDAAFRAVEKNLHGMERASRSAITGIQGLVAGFGVGFLVNRTKQALDFADSIKEMAKQTGLSTAALQGLQQVQVQSGGSIESFNAGMTKFTQIIGDAANGSEEAVKALARVGISVKDLQSLSMEQLYIKASNALSKYVDAGTRASVVQDLFGKAAKDSANAFAVSAAEIESLRAAALASGQVLDESTIKNAKKAKDEMAALARVIDIQLTQAFVQAGPLLVKSAELLANLAEMAGWAARRIGILNDVTDEQKYQSLLEKRLDISERIFQMEKGGHGPFGGSFTTEYLAEQRSELTRIDAQLDLMRKKQREDAARPAPQSPAITGAIVPVKQKGDDKLQKGNDKLQKEFERQLEFDAQQFDQAMQQYDRLRGQYDARLALELDYGEKKRQLQWNADKGYIDDDDTFKQLARQMEIEHQQKLTDIEDAELRKRFGAQKIYRQLDMESAGAFAGGLANLMQGTSKKQFEIGKKAAIAQTIINTYESAVAAFTSFAKIPIVGTVLGAAAAAAAVSFGLSQVQRIRAQQFEGGGAGGGVPTFAASPNTGLPAGTPGGGFNPVPLEPASGQGGVTIIINGTIVNTQEWLENIAIPGIYEAVRNKDIALIPPGSRNALDLAAA